MGGNGGLRLGEDSVGVGLIGEREVGRGVGWRCGLAAQGLGWLGPVTLRPVEVCVGGLGLRSAWAGDVEAGGGVGQREWSD